jgi:prepilin-type N-terminal cleavage/methylation domain-containing protein
MSEVVQPTPLSGLSARVSAQAGYSVIELMMVTAIVGVVTGMAVIQIGSSRQGLNGDGAMRVVLSQLNQAKELAITQRRNMRLTFTNNSSVQILREEVPAGAGPTTISSVPFEGGLTFLRPAGVPDINVAGNVPVLSEVAAALSPTLSTGTGVAFGNATVEMKFAPDGTLIDQDGLTLNGALFVARANQTLSTRAVAVFGSTGRIRAYRWDGRNWKPV